MDRSVERAADRSADWSALRSIEHARTGPFEPITGSFAAAAEAAVGAVGKNDSTGVGADVTSRMPTEAFLKPPTPPPLPPPPSLPPAAPPPGTSRSRGGSLADAPSTPALLVRMLCDGIELDLQRPRPLRSGTL